MSIGKDLDFGEVNKSLIKGYEECLVAKEERRLARIENERLLKIGRAIENLFKKGKVDILLNATWCHGEFEGSDLKFSKIEEILQWTEREKKGDI